MLENFHTASAFRVLTMPECNVLSTLTKGEWIEARKTIIRCILATDMSHHFDMVAKLDTVFEKLERINQNNSAAAAAAAAAKAATAATNASAATVDGTTAVTSAESPTAAAVVDVHATSPLPPRDDAARIRANTSMLPISPSSSSGAPSASTSSPSSDTSAPSLELSRDEILHLLTILLHSADISNPGKPWRVARLWGDRIQSENFNQGDLERLKGLVVSPFMDRAQENQPQTSINFGDFIVAPLMAAIVRAFPPLLPLAENLIKNRKIWHQAQLDRIAHAIRAGGLSGAALSAKEAERKSLTNKAQVFRNCFVLPIRKIATVAHAGTNNNAAATTGAATAAAPAAANGASNFTASGASAASQNGSASASVASNGAAAAASSSAQPQQHQPHQHHASIAEGEEDETADASSPLAAVVAAQSQVTAPADNGDAATNSAPTVVAPAAAADAPSGAAAAAVPASQAASTTVASGVPLVRSTSASGSLDLTSTQESRVLERADALLNAVQSLVKRRHSMLENGTVPNSTAGAGSAANGAAQPSRQGTASLGEHLGLARVSGAGGVMLSHSQPHTPTLASLRSQQTPHVHLSADDHAPLSPPRRASLSMAQALISSSPGLGSLSVDGSLAASSDGGNGELQSPILSPDSRAVAEAISRSSSIVERQVITPLHSPHSTK